MNKKIIIAVLAGWLLSLVIQPQALLGKFRKG